MLIVLPRYVAAVAMAVHCSCSIGSDPQESCCAITMNV